MTSSTKGAVDQGGSDHVGEKSVALRKNLVYPPVWDQPLGWQVSGKARNGTGWEGPAYAGAPTDNLEGRCVTDCTSCNRHRPHARHATLVWCHLGLSQTANLPNRTKLFKKKLKPV